MEPAYRLVRVEWQDAATVDEWGPVSEVSKTKPEVCQTVGWLLYQDGLCVVVAGTVGGEDANSVMVIPAGCVTGVKTLGEVPG